MRVRTCRNGSSAGNEPAIRSTMTRRARLQRRRPDSSTPPAVSDLPSPNLVGFEDCNAGVRAGQPGGRHSAHGAEVRVVAGALAAACHSLGVLEKRLRLRQYLLRVTAQRTAGAVLRVGTE